MLQDTQTQIPATAGFRIDRDTSTIRFERTLDAPAEQVFDAWTDPDQIRCWWDPTGEPLLSCAIDLRPEGAFRFVTRSHPEHPFAGVYRVIQRPNLLEFDAAGARGKVHLSELGGQTQMVVEINCASAQHLEQFVAMGAVNGTSKTLDNLVLFAACK